MAKEGDRNREEETTEEEKQNISVKGVRRDIYGRVLNLTRETGRTLGDITNEAYRTFLSTVEGAKHLSKNFIEGATKSNVKYIENIKSLSLSRKDLQDMQGKVAFKNMDTLVFEDVTTEDIARHVESISNVKIVHIPPTVSKAAILLRSTYIDKLEVSDSN